MLGRGASYGLLAAVAGTAVAQFDNWLKNQVSTEICLWYQPRGALIRDTIYMDGGDIWWLPRLKDGTTGDITDGDNPRGLILNYNLSTPFNSKSNVTKILLNKALATGRGGGGNGGMPSYYDGGMLANYYQFYLYGGSLLSEDSVYSQPDADEIMDYQFSQYGPDRPAWTAGFNDAKLPDDVTRYVASGGAVSAPSENLAWYFSGLRSPTHEIIYTDSTSLKTRAANVSNSLITLDMANQLDAKWTNSTLPKIVDGRSNAEVVWVPVGKQGVLVVLGGAVDPEWAGDSHSSPDPKTSKKESPQFMEDIDIYDIAKHKWYKQPTKDGPGALARGCAVVAPASDYSSFNIFYYGGYDGVDVTADFSDAVWVLSIPSFTWTKINEGTSLHARAGHRCFSPYPDQMMSLGGYTPLKGESLTCLDKGPVVLFNLTSGEWMDSYDPSKYSDYGVHEKIQSKIGGNAAGGATVTTPVPSGWATSALGDVFQTSYDTKKIKTYYPYHTAGSSQPTSTSGRDTGGDGAHKHKGGSGLPTWGAVVLGVVLGVAALTAALVAFCLWRRRKVLRNRSSDAGTEDTGMRIMTWMRGQQPLEKVTEATSTEETPRSPELGDARALSAADSRVYDPRAAGTTSPMTPEPITEMPDSHIVELADTSLSPRPELYDTGLSPVDIVERHSHFAKDKSRSVTSPSNNSTSLGGADAASSVSRSSAAQAGSVQAASNMGTPKSAHARLASDVSESTEPDAHTNTRVTSVSPDLLGRSDSSALGAYLVSPRSEDGRAPIYGNIDESEESSVVEPQSAISPPTGEERAGEDYLASKPSSAPLRKKSVFREEDINKPK